MANLISGIFVDESCLWIKRFESKFKESDFIKKFDFVGGACIGSSATDSDIYSFVKNEKNPFDTIITADSDFKTLDEKFYSVGNRPFVMRVARNRTDLTFAQRIDMIICVITHINQRKVSLPKNTKLVNVDSFYQRFISKQLYCLPGSGISSQEK